VVGGQRTTGSLLLAATRNQRGEAILSLSSGLLSRALGPSRPHSRSESCSLSIDPLGVGGGIGNSIGDPEGIGNTIGDPGGIDNSIGDPEGIDNSIGDPEGIGNSIGDPEGIHNPIGDPERIDDRVTQQTRGTLDENAATVSSCEGMDT